MGGRAGGGEEWHHPLSMSPMRIRLPDTSVEPPTWLASSRWHHPSAGFPPKEALTSSTVSQLSGSQVCNNLFFLLLLLVSSLVMTAQAESAAENNADVCQTKTRCDQWVTPAPGKKTHLKAANDMKHMQGPVWRRLPFSRNPSHCYFTLRPHDSHEQVICKCKNWH